jgi:hypothetical protein
LSATPGEQTLPDLIASGRLRVGTELFHPNHRGEATARATIITEGVEVDGNTYLTPSAAASAVSTSRQNGWKYWRVTATGEPLETLRGAPRASGRWPVRPRATSEFREMFFRHAQKSGMSLIELATACGYDRAYWYRNLTPFRAIAPEASLRLAARHLNVDPDRLVAAAGYGDH